MDKRIEKTKEKLKKGLICLLEENGLNDITVSQLCNIAGVNRSTFYVYYNNIAECFGEISDEIIAEMKKELYLMPDRNAKTYLHVYFQTARRHQDIFKTIHTTNIHNPMIKKMVEINNEILHSGLYIPQKAENLKFSFIFSGFYGMVEVWLRNGCKESDEELMEALQAILTKTL